MDVDSFPQSSNVCPLCQSEIRLFFINFNEKMLMCENTECEFPFGHEELRFVKEDIDVDSDVEVASIQSKMSPMSASVSMVSAAAWSEIDKLTNTCEDSQFESIDLPHRNNRANSPSKILIQKNIADIKELSNQLVSSLDRNVNIKNRKWIRNLQSIQDSSGIQLLKPEEAQLLKKEEPVLGLGELKIDIDHGSDNCMSTIKIEINKI